MLPEHLAHQIKLEKQGIMFGAGPLATEDGARVGGMVIIRAEFVCGGARHRRRRPVSQERPAHLHADQVDGERRQLRHPRQLLRPDRDDRMIRLAAHDGHELDAYLARPSGRVRGGMVIAQEMYGVNAYLRSVCDFYAAQGYVAIAPALYDRRQRGLTYTYSKDDHDRAQKTYTAWNLDDALADLDAARGAIADAGKIAIIGFCWGGSLAWLSACRSDYAGAVSYYGSMIPDLANEQRALPGHLPYRRQGHVAAAGARRRSSARRSRRSRSTCMKARRTVSTTRTAPSAITPPPTSSRASARSNSWLSTWASAPRYERGSDGRSHSANWKAKLSATMNRSGEATLPGRVSGPLLLRRHRRGCSVRRR